jgi:hypothetical protein
MKSNILLSITWLLAMTILIFSNGRGDAPSLEDQRASIKNRSEELESEYKLALQSSQGASQLQTTLRKAISNIDAASTPVTTGNANLPASFTDLYFPKQPKAGSGAEGAMKPGFMGLGANNFSDQFTLLWAGRLINTAPEILMPILEERAKVFPPTAADYILYGAVSAAIDDNNYDLTPHGSPTDPTQVSLSRSAGLLQLAHAKNPIYRLLAARAGVFVERDEAKRLNFYSAYLNESDPTIQTAAVTGLANAKTPAAVATLQSFQTAAQQHGNAQGAKAAEEAIQRINKQNSPKGQ